MTKKISNLLFATAILLFSAVLIQHFNISDLINKKLLNKEIQNTATINNTGKIKTKISYAQHIEKGNSRFKNGYNTLAIAEYTNASQIEPRMPEPYMKIGEIHFSEKNFIKALENFRIASQINQEDIEPKILIAIVYINLNEFEKAENILNNINGENSRLFYYRSLLNIVYNKFDDAKFNLNKVIELNEDQIIITKVNILLDAFQKFEKSEGAKEIFRLTLLAKAISEVNEHNLAIQIAYQVLEKNPDYRDIWIILGYSYLNLEKYFDALSSFEKALELDPSKPETLYFIGLTHLKQQEYGLAINNLELALRNGFQPKNVIYQELGEAYLNNKEYKNSAKYYEKLIKEEPQNIDAFIKVIWLYLDIIGNKTKATQLAQNAVKNNPDLAQSYNLLGWANTMNGDMESAKNNLDKALQLDENLAAAYLNLGLWNEQQNNITEAKLNYKRAYELEKTTGVGEKALKKYNAIIKLEAENMKSNEIEESTNNISKNNTKTTIE